MSDTLDEMLHNALFDNLERDAVTVICEDVAYSVPIQLSIAISLKRIADEMERRINADGGSQ